MKNLIIVLISIVSFGFAFSQERVADFGNDSQTYSKNRTNGVYIFHVSADEYTMEKVNKAASYYKDNFNVTTKKNGDHIKVQVSLKGISKENKNVVQRLFAGLEIKKIHYNGQTFDNPLDFLTKYI